jgi:5-methylcytosine-specific restriction endonuclease McrA
MSTASLFPNHQKSRFLEITGQRYRAMQVRLQRKNLPPPPFTLAQLRTYLLDVMGDRYDGAMKCRYCGRVCDISEVELDHEIPLSRGGGLGLDNIGTPCARCNAAKGQSTSEEWTLFMQFLEKNLPFARADILDRLSKYGKLVSAKRQAEMLARSKGEPTKKRKPGKPPLVAAIEEVF